MLNTMFYRTVFLLLILTALSIIKVSANEEQFQELFEAYEEIGNYSGTALIANKDDILYKNATGMANHEWEIPNTMDCKFRIGSITKIFTSIITMQLNESGDLSLEDPLSKYIQYPGGNQITIRHLLSHTSGIPNFTNFDDFKKTAALPSPPEETIDRFREKGIEFEPGSQFSYSNSGYVLLGYILESVTDSSYEALVASRIAEPLGLEGTGYDNNSEIIPLRASGYKPDNGTLQNADYVHMSVPHAAGALYSTAEDLYKVSRALLDGKLVSEASLEKMWTPVKERYGLGWLIQDDGGRKVVGHGGGIQGFASNLLIFPEEEVIIAVLSNYQTGPVGEISNQLAAIVFDLPYDLPEKRTVASVDPEIYQKFTGEYELFNNVYLTVTTEDNKIYAQLTGQPRLEIYPSSETSYFYKVVNATIDFHVNENGEVTGLTLEQSGRQMSGEPVR